MATKKDIVEAVVLHLLEATGTYTDSDDSYELENDDVRPQFPDAEEDDVAIGWTDTYNPLNVNGVGNSVKQDVEGGVVQSETYTSASTAQYIITIQAPNVAILDQLYEAVYREFDKYKATDLTASDFHSDVRRVATAQTNSFDDEDAEDVVRRDQLTVELTFTRDYEVVEDTITEIRLDLGDNGVYEYTVDGTN